MPRKRRTTASKMVRPMMGMLFGLGASSVMASSSNKMVRGLAPLPAAFGVLGFMKAMR